VSDLWYGWILGFMVGVPLSLFIREVWTFYKQEKERRMREMVEDVLQEKDVV